MRLVQPHISQRAVQVDRTGWPPGPWDGEPDNLEWVDETGYSCQAIRSPLGTWCGYVGIPVGHPWYGKNYDLLEVGVHGGLTVATRQHCSDLELLSVLGEVLWVLGFDCAHAWDVIPCLKSRHPEGDVYRTLEFVKGECSRLCRQAREEET